MSAVSKISFDKSSFENQSLPERHRKRPLLSSISQMSDGEIIRASVKNANKQAENTSAARALKNGPLIFTAATAIAAGALTGGRLSNKALSAIEVLGAAGAVYAVSKPVQRVTGAIFNKTDEDGNKKSSSPVAEAVATIGATIGGAALLIFGAKKGGDKLAKVFAPSAKEIGEKAAQAASKLNSSKLGKFSDKIENYAARNPKTASALKATGITAMTAALAGGALNLSQKVADTRDEAFNSNVNKLVLMREFAQSALDD